MYYIDLIFYLFTASMAFTLEGIIDNHVYVGGIKNTSSPKTKNFWLGTDQWTVILSPEAQLKALNDAYLTVQQAKQDGKEIVVVCQKSWLSESIASLAKSFGFHYLTHKLPAGFLTNFDTLFSTIQQMNEKKNFVMSDNFSKLTKKEQSMIKRYLGKIEKIYEGVKDLKKKPDLVVVVDGSALDGLVAELQITKTPNIVLASTSFSKRWSSGDFAVINMQNQKSPIYVLETLFS
jgi:small subunit ribosomal protein S2